MDESSTAASHATTLTAASAALYASDTVLWSEMQARLLRQVAAGKRPKGIDWENIVEEIESVGRSLVNAVESLLLQALIHEFKAQLWPTTSHVEGWRNESLQFQVQAAAGFMPSMRQKIDPWKLVELTMRAVPPTIDQIGPAAPPASLAIEAHDQVQKWIADPDHSAISLTGEQPLTDFVQRGT